MSESWRGFLYGAFMIVVPILLMIAVFLLTGCGPAPRTSYEIAADNYRACLSYGGNCERQRAAFQFERDQAQIRQMGAVSAAAQQQQLLNSMAIYNSLSSPCGIGIPCR